MHYFRIRRTELKKISTGRRIYRSRFSWTRTQSTYHFFTPDERKHKGPVCKCSTVFKGRARRCNFLQIDVPFPLRYFCIVKVKAVVGWQRSLSPVEPLSSDMQFHSVIYKDKCLTQQNLSHRVIWLCSGKLARGSGFMIKIYLRNWDQSQSKDLE